MMSLQKIKTMKYLIYPMLILFFASCDVDRPLKDAISDQSYWKSEEDLIAAANYLYTFLPELPVSDDNWADDGFGLVANEISSGTRIAPSVDDEYKNHYKLIRAANNFIEKSSIALTTGVEQNTINKYVGEALFFRAWAYTELVMRYGDVPLVLSVLTDVSDELYAPKSSRAQVMEAIYQDLDKAAGFLPTPSKRGSKGYGRVTNTAALSLKARSALFEGTRSKFHNYGNPEKHLQIAIEASEKVINSGQHELFSSYFDLFQYAGEGRQNKENIFVAQHGISVGNDIRSYNAGFIINGANNITKTLVDAYLMKDGLPIDQSPLYTEPVDHSAYFENRDPRMAHTIFKKGDPYNQDATFTIPSLTYHVTGFVSRKYLDPKELGTNNRTFIDRVLIRYAEVLLIYAEATYELNGSISDADLNQSINLLRERVGMPKLTNEFVDKNGLDMREEIRRERRIELAVEGFRYWDIIRWKTAEQVLPVAVLGSYYFEDGFGTGEPNLTDDNYILVQKGSTRTFDPQKDYLWPFPVEELALNTNLVQNPGW